MLLPNDLTELFNQYVKSKINQVMSELNTFSLNDSYETFACIFTEVLHGEDYHKMIAKAQAEAAEKMRLEMDLLLAQERSNAEKARQEAAKLLMQERLTVEKTEKALQKERLAAEKTEKTLQKERLAAKKAEKERLDAEKALQQERLDAEKALQQERLDAEKAMILRFYQKKWSIEQIAEMMELDPLFIKQVVEHHP
jgi:bifunctional ADP-heptose synthase (sugar kinase/adenylyltransferase)